MADGFFKIFSEAASYAKLRAQELSVSVKLERNNEGWVVVIPEYSQPQYSQPNASKPAVTTVCPIPDESRLPEYEGRAYWGDFAEETAQRKLEREQRQRDQDDQKAYEEAIRANTPRIKEPECEACGKPISRCRCSG